MGTVAERDIRGMTATANGDGRSSGEAKSLSFLIHNFEIPFNAYGAVAENGHFGSRHKFLRETFYRFLAPPCTYKIASGAGEYKKAGRLRVASRFR
jgi:hypothetical protein